MTKVQQIGIVFSVSSLALFLLLMDVHSLPTDALKMALAPWFFCGLAMIVLK